MQPAARNCSDAWACRVLQGMREGRRGARRRAAEKCADTSPAQLESHRAKSCHCYLPRIRRTPLRGGVREAPGEGQSQAVSRRHRGLPSRSPAPTRPRQPWRCTRLRPPRRPPLPLPRARARPKRRPLSPCGAIQASLHPRSLCPRQHRLPASSGAR